MNDEVSFLFMFFTVPTSCHPEEAPRSVGRTIKYTLSEQASVRRYENHKRLFSNKRDERKFKNVPKHSKVGPADRVGIWRIVVVSEKEGRRKKGEVEKKEVLAFL